MVVDPDAERDPNKRGKGHGPTNKTEHPKTKPDAPKFAALRFELASLLHTHLATQGCSIRSGFDLMLLSHVETPGNAVRIRSPTWQAPNGRSEEHTSELQSREN